MLKFIKVRENKENMMENGVFIYIIFKSKIVFANIPVLFEKVLYKYDIVDKSVYNRNRLLFTPMNKIKKDDVVPELQIVNGKIF
jgi:hypothetical protein